MEQEVYYAADGAALAMVCGALLGAGFSQDAQASRELMKSAHTTGAAVLSFAGVRAVAEVNRRGEASITFSASTRGALAPVLSILNNRPIPGTGRPIVALLKSRAQAQQEAATQRRQEQAQRRQLAEAPAQEAAARAAARQVAAWRCSGTAAIIVESRLLLGGAVSCSGPDGMQAVALGSETTIQIQPDPAGVMVTITLESYRSSDFSTAVRLILGSGREQLMPIDLRKREAQPQRMKKSHAGAAVDALLKASDRELRAMLGKLPPRRKAGLKKTLDRR